MTCIRLPTLDWPREIEPNSIEMLCSTSYTRPILVRGVVGLNGLPRATRTTVASRRTWRCYPATHLSFTKFARIDELRPCLTPHLDMYRDLSVSCRSTWEHGRIVRDTPTAGAGLQRSDEARTSCRELHWCRQKRRKDLKSGTFTP